MKFNNPIGLFNDAQINRLSPDNLKSVKKEILLEFQLSEDTTIEKNGIKYDKSTVLQIFDSLHKDLELHLAIYRNKPLYQFLVNGNLAFFDSKKAIEDTAEIETYESKIDSFISNKLNTIVPGLISNFDFKTLDRLQKIQAYTSSMDSHLQDQAYEKTYTEISAFVKDLPKEFPQPFESAKGIKLHPKIHDKINTKLYNCFKYLPGAFKDMAHSYGVWCHNEVANEAFRRERRYEKYSRKDLTSLYKAMQIGCRVTNSEAFKDNTKTIKQYLAGTTSSSSSNGASTGKAIFWIVLILFKIVLIAHRCNDSSRSNRETALVNNTFQNNINSERYKEIRRLQNNSKSLDRAKKVALQRYSGDNWGYWVPKLKNTREEENYKRLNYNVELFPTEFSDFKKIIDKSIIDKYKKQEEQQFVLNFTNPDFPNISMRHRVKAKFRNDDLYYIYYDNFKKTGSEKVKLTTTRFSRNRGQLKGTITRMGDNPKQIIHKEKFSINFNKSEYDRLKKVDKDPYEVESKFEKYKAFQITGLKNENLKNVILNNLSEVHHKALKMGNYYTSKKMAYYSPSNDKLPIKFSVDEVEIGKGSMTFSHGSMEDDIGVIKVDSKEFQIRYFANKATKKVLGMHMVVQHPTTKQVDVIEVFYE